MVDTIDSTDTTNTVDTVTVDMVDTTNTVNTTTTTVNKNNPHSTTDKNCNNKIPGPKNKFGPQSKNLGSIIRGYKSAVTTYARKNNIDFHWQDRFHDHKIRSPADFMRISDYIKNNPINFHKKNYQ